jgi:hypothetical protein
MTTGGCVTYDSFGNDPFKNKNKHIPKSWYPWTIFWIVCQLKCRLLALVVDVSKVVVVVVVACFCLLCGGMCYTNN